MKQEVPSFVDARMDQKEVKIRKVFSCLFVVVEMDCFLEQTDPRIQKVMFDCMQIFVFAMIMTELSVDYLIDPSYRFCTTTNLER